MRTEEQGFTLVEVLVALVVSSLLLAVVLDGSLLARERSVHASEKREALLLARHLIRRAAVEPAGEVTAEGREGELGWRVERRSVASDPRGRLVLAAIAVTVTGSGGVALARAETRRLIPAGGR